MHSGRALVTIAASVAIACGCLAFAGCTASAYTASSSASSSAKAFSTGDLIAAADEAGVDTSDVAAVVDGVVITQQEVGATLQRSRISSGLSSNASYQSYLSSAGLTEREVRLRSTMRLVRAQLIAINAAERGIEVTDDELNEAISALKDRYPSQESWLEALEASGYDEESYAATVRSSMLSSRLKEAVTADIEPTQEQIQEYAVAFAPTLAGRRSSMILFSQNDYVLAHEVYNKLVNGADFAQLAEKYSIDGTADEGGDMGWDSINNLDSDYQSVLNDLDPGEYSSVVRLPYGYAIILCTDRYQPSYEGDGSIDLDAIPDDLMQTIVSTMKANLADDEFERYLSELEASVTLAVFDEDGAQVSPEELGLVSDSDAATELDGGDIISEDTWGVLEFDGEDGEVSSSDDAAGSDA